MLFLLALAGGCGQRTTAAAPAPGPPAQPRLVAPRLVAVEVFDTDPESRAQVIARHAPALRAALQRGATDVGGQLAAEIRADGDYAYVEPSLVTYFDTHTSYLTIDIVDRRDEARRMPFRDRPTGSYPDPGRLIAAWEAYDAKVHELLRRGQLRPPPAHCPSFHCLGDPSQPELAPLAAAFAPVADHHDELARILRDDGRASHRASAAFLLAYLTDGNTVVADLVPALHDSSALVRNNAMRVLAEIALHHPEVDIPIEPVIEALGFPSTSDRNKAAATLYRLVARPDGAKLHRRIVRDAGPVLLTMLQLAQPNNHDFAYKVLTEISGQRYGERDYATWQTWLDAATTDR